MRRRLAATIAAITAVSLLWATPAPADAKNPPPPKSLATNTIDAHLGYMPQSTCSPAAKPGTTALLKALIATWGGGSSGISRACSVGTTSEHKEGRALDWHMDVKSASQRKRVAQALDWLTANNGEVAYRLGVMYIIWNQHIWSLYYPELGWRKMADRGSYTANHKNHVHISLSWDGAMKQTSWWTGVPITTPLNSKCGVNGARACLPTIARTSLAWPYQTTVVPESFLPAPWKVPGIGGDPQVDRTLTAVPGTWVPDGAQLAYQWTADGKDIAGATASTFVVTPDQLGKGIRVRVTADGTTTRTSDVMTDVLKARFGTTPKPVIGGTAATGQTVVVDPGTWTATPDSLTITWQRNGKAIKGASGVGATSYTLTASDTGKKLSVTVTARRSGYVTVSRTSATVKVAKGTFTTAPVPTVSGDAVAGGVLTADPGTWDPTPTKFSYQWYVAGKAIKKATKATFTVASSQAGKEIVVRVKATRSGFTTTYVRSEPVAIAPA
ncbi:MAG: hypothetical protein QM779_13590 [Propionicimonas sp.]|uniref:hypothetical protein n=1 Tax=Propionicimonas sp. TaxID=1955623 RepID=UPI003D0B75F2